ncbi:MAG: RidA family protein [Anaerolineales bacterium]|jgi:2-iminobutanoate/2-iminopropanoate deaminase
MSPKEVLVPNDAPKAIGPYSAGIRVGQMVFTAGQLGIDSESGELVPGGVVAETRQALQNLSAVLKEAGVSREHVVKTTVFLRDMNDFSQMNEVYAQFFPADPPARSAIQVARLPKDAAIEIEAIAVIE